MTSDDPLKTASGIIREIYGKFADYRQQQRPDAYRYLHEALSRNAHHLCPIVIPLKDLNALLMDLENFLKGSTAREGSSPNEYLERWLQGEDLNP